MTNDPRFEFRLRATVELASKDPDAVAVQFTHIKDMTDEEKAVVEAMGKKGQVIVRDRPQPVSGKGMLLPKAAAQEVQAGLPYVFNVSHFVSAYKSLGARPDTGSPTPEHTNADWCAYHEPTGAYLYTRAFVKYLIKKCSTPEGFEAATGRKPKPLT